ncbi:hypothetical protein niasHT_015632 [Heterodera trifolii]|uniref:Uncharacterized protein n=1 Tax=Heterodera trifolii TaxID=157864 RepID=A0ABD2L4K4_9BILA
MQIVLLLFFFTFSLSFGREILPSVCPCRDWHGGCRRLGENWTDNGIWAYRCAIGASNSIFEGCLVNSKSGKVHKIEAGNNETVDEFWVKCETDEIRHKLEFEPKCVVGEEYKRIGENFRKGIFQWICLENGRWIIGCYYRNETDGWNLLRLGESVNDGLIRHNCARFGDGPGVAQFHSEIRDDISHESPSNRGHNKMLTHFVDKRLKNHPTEWTHQNAPLFVAEAANVRVRYLPASRKTIGG